MKYYKIVQIELIIVSMLLFLGCHILLAFINLASEIYFLTYLINASVFMEFCLFIAFLLLFVVIILIGLESSK